MSADQSFRVLPSNVDYTKILPLAVESRSRRRTFFPVNGQTFSSGANNIIRIDVSADAFLDPKHSYLRFTMTNDTGQAMGLDFGGGHGFIQRMRIEQAGNVLSDVNNYGKLLSSILLPAQGGIGSTSHRSITEGVRYANGSAGPAGMTTDAPAAEQSGALSAGCGANGNLQLAALAQYTFAIPIVNGLLGTTQDKMVPLQLLGSSPLTIEIEISPALDIGIYPAAPGAGGYTLSNIRYVAQLVEVGPEVDQQLRMVQEMSGGRLVLNGVDYTHFNGNIPLGAQGNQVINVPARRKSLKSLLFVGASKSYAGGAAQHLVYNQSYGGNFRMRDYQAKFGSVLHPPTPVDCGFSGAAGAAGVRAEALTELAKCFGTVASTQGQGVLSSISYAPLDCDVANMTLTGAAGAPATVHRFAPFGLDLEAFQRTAIESGINTADRSLPISLIINCDGAAATEAINVDCYVSYDSLYYIDQQGSIRVSM
tara:strand:+ start:1566 stop:3005 length:1440 start_codon:yes stop_codon:yes gene_type:complete